MPRYSNSVRQCPRCPRIGRQNRHTSYAFHTVREVECASGHLSHTVELFTGESLGYERAKKVGQTRELMQIIAQEPLEIARVHVEGLNARYQELAAAGAVLKSNAIRTCPACGEPSHILYGSNQGQYVRHGYECKDRECTQRWLSAEYAMAPAPAGTDLSELTTCLALMRQAAEPLLAERVARLTALHQAIQCVHRERADLIKEITSSRNIRRLTDVEVLSTAREFVKAAPAATFDEFRAELARRFDGRTGWRGQVLPLWEQAREEL